MKSAFYIGWKYFLRHKLTSVVTALAIAVPLFVACIGMVADTSSRPSPRLQHLAMAGQGSALLLPKNESATIAELSGMVEESIEQVNLGFEIPAVANEIQTTVNTDQRQWSSRLFASMLVIRSGTLPQAADQIAISSALAKRLGIGIGGSLSLGGTPLVITGIADRPYALDSQVAYLDSVSSWQPTRGGNQINRTQYVLAAPLPEAAVAELSAQSWLYLVGDKLVTKTSPLANAPMGYVAVLVVTFIGLLAGVWTLSARSRRAAGRALTDLGISRAELVGAGLVEAFFATVAGLAFGAALLAIAAPMVHRHVSEAARVVPDSGYFPWGETALTAAGVMVLVLLTSVGFQLWLGKSAPIRHGRPAAKTRSLPKRVRRAARSRTLSVFSGLALCTALAATTGVLWLTSNRSTEMNSPGTRRPGDIEVILRGNTAAQALAQELADTFHSDYSMVATAVSRTGVDTRPAIAGLARTSSRGAKETATPIQVIATNADWRMLTGREPTAAEWDALQSGLAVTFDPTIIGNTTTLRIGDTQDGVEVPIFAASVDKITRNRAKAAVGRGFLRTHGLEAEFDAVMVNTDRSDMDAAAADTGAILTKYGISGGDLRIGRPYHPSPPIIVVLLTFGSAILAGEFALFSALAAAADERRTRRLLDALGAGFGRQWSLAFGATGIVTVAGACIGIALGIAIASAITVMVSPDALTIPWVLLGALLAALTAIAAGTAALVAGLPTASRTGRR